MSVHYYYFLIISTTSLTIVLVLLLLTAFLTSYGKVRFDSVVAGVFIFYIFRFLRFQAFGAFIEPLVLLCVLSFSDKDKSDALAFITKCFSIIVGVSLLVWLLYLCGVPISGDYIELMGYSFYRTNFFLVNTIIGLDQLPRFQSLLLEPGHLGTICALLLFANRYKIKENFLWVLLLAIIFSFSTAAYILTILGYILYLISKGNKTVILYVVIIIGVLIISLIYLISRQDNIFYQLVVRKIVEGDGVGSSRYGNAFLQLYHNQMSRPFVALFGMGGSFEIEQFSGTSGYRVGLITIGYFGVTLLFFAYYNMARAYRHNKLCYFFLLLYVVSYIQRPYADWLAEWFIFILSLPGLQNNEVKK